MDALIESLKIWFDKHGTSPQNVRVQVTKRVLVVSSKYDISKHQTLFDEFNSEGVTVWTRENLEPTISIVEEVKIDAKSLPRKNQINNMRESRLIMLTL